MHHSKKRHAFTCVALGAALLTGGYAIGQSLSKPPVPAATQPAGKQPKLIKMATLNTVEANREFQGNMQLIQAQRQAVIELNAAMEKEKDEKKKKELKTQLDSLFAKLNENNQAMQKTYGFSLERNYVMEIEKSNIYLIVSEEEAARIEKTEQAKGAKEKKKK